MLPQVPRAERLFNERAERLWIQGRKALGLTGRTRSSQRELRAWESGDRDWVLESEMSVAEVGERHLACVIEVGRETHQERRRVGRCGGSCLGKGGTARRRSIRVLESAKRT